jgi:hypothetical protein
MRIATFDISRISTTVRRHEALLRYARYLFIFNIGIFLWVAIPQLWQVTSFRGLTELVVGPAWQWAKVGARLPFASRGLSSSGDKRQATIPTSMSPAIAR